MFQFIKKLIVKYDNVLDFIYQRKCQIYPTVPLHKLIDPFGFIYSFLMQYSLENKVRPT